MGVLKNGEDIWIKRLDDVKKYIDKNHQRPSTHNKEKSIKQLGQWISTQIKNYKSKKQIMIVELIYNKWTDFINDDDYKKFFFKNREDKWINRLDDVKKYIDKNGQKPSRNDKEEKIKQLGHWISDQLKNYKSKKKSMANELIYSKWTEFINDDDYKKFFFKNHEDKWIDNLENVKKYIDEKGQRPSESNKEENIKQLGQWINTQMTNYKTKKNSMANELIYNKWAKFINEEKYKIFFLKNREDNWIKRLDDVKKYIDENDKRPSSTNKEQNIKQLGQWISDQLKNYKSKEKIMANELIHDKWTDFINENNYKKFFLLNKDK